MSGPLNTSAQIKEVDAALKTYIQQAQSGKNDINELFGIEKQLAALAKNPKIPEQVRQSLQSAIQELKQMQSGNVNISHLYTAKMQLDNALHGTLSKTEDVKKAEGGSLGGGGSGGSQE